LLAVGFGGLLLGVLLLAVAAKPRNRRHIGTRGTPALWLRPTDIARATTAAALRVDGVEHAHTVAGKRTVEVHIVTQRATGDYDESVLAAATAALAELANPPRIKVAHPPGAAPSPRKAVTAGVRTAVDKESTAP
jgi:hypothetical protein